MRLTDTDIVCFANDWRTDPTSKHHLMRRFAAKNRVLWVESAGMRRPNLGSSDDWGRILRKAKSFSQPSRQELPGLHAYAPPSIPLPGSNMAQRVNTELYRHTITRELQRLQMSPAPVLWVYAPHVAPMIRKLPRSLLVYHCVDRWSAFADYDAELMDAYEAELCKRADVVFASAEDLAERCRRYSTNVHYVPHGVDHAHFRQALEDGPEPADVAHLPRPRVGFFGLIHEWVDVELIGRLADALPYEFILIGASNQNLNVLLENKRVHHLGRKPFSELPAYSRAFDAAIVPFRRSELTMSVNPIKLREYAAAGLPVVSTGLPEVVRCGDIVRIADDTATWITQLTAAVKEGADRAWRVEQSSRVLGEDWSAICDRIAEQVLAVSK